MNWGREVHPYEYTIHITIYKVSISDVISLILIQIENKTNYPLLSVMVDSCGVGFIVNKKYATFLLSFCPIASVAVLSHAEEPIQTRNAISHF